MARRPLPQLAQTLAHLRQADGPQVPLSLSAAVGRPAPRLNRRQPPPPTVSRQPLLGRRLPSCFRIDLFTGSRPQIQWNLWKGGEYLPSGGIISLTIPAHRDNAGPRYLTQPLAQCVRVTPRPHRRRNAYPVYTVLKGRVTGVFTCSW